MNPHVISWMNVEVNNADYDPDDIQFKYRILAEGDSWFSLRGIPTSNLLVTLDLPGQAIIVSYAQPGDTIRMMGDMVKNEGVKRMTGKKFGYDWHAILLSGGGNDLIDDAKRIIKKSTGGNSNVPAAYCDESALQQTLLDVSNGYTQIVKWRDRKGSTCPGCPIITHTYDWTTPRNAPARFFGLKLKGPWLYKALIQAQVPKPMWIPVSDYLLGRLGQTIESLESSLPNFKVAKTQGTLVRAELDTTLFSNDWADEIHPSMKGYDKLAKKVAISLLNAVP